MSKEDKISLLAQWADEFADYLSVNLLQAIQRGKGADQAERTERAYQLCEEFLHLFSEDEIKSFAHANELCEELYAHAKRDGFYMPEFPRTRARSED